MKQKTILIIDDEPLILEVASAMVRRLGYNSVVTTDPFFGIDTVGTQSIDAVMIDITMPRLDGFETAKEIRKKSSIPIIYMSGFETIEPKVFGIFVPKPFGYKTIRDVFSNLFGDEI